MRSLWSLFFLILCVSCLESYTPRVNFDSLDLLVVDGSINANGSAIVKLSRSLPLPAYGANPKETGATLIIESSTGENFSLTEEDRGTYVASDLPVNTDDRFTLNVRTAKGEEYRSDEVQMYPTPPIDKVSFVVSPTGQSLRIKVDANDPNRDATGYYYWDGIETYSYHADVYAGYKLVNHVAVRLLPEEETFTCWIDKPVPYVVASVNSLSESTIASQTVASIPQYSKKISIRYSILVRQRAISEAEYNFRKQIQVTTEQQGDLFAQIPGPVVGNVHSLADPDEYVLGYFSANQTTEKRFFIEYEDLPAAFKLQKQRQDCQPELSCYTNTPSNGPSLCLDIVNIAADAGIITIVSNSAEQYAYLFVRSECSDCRTSAGKTTPPPFW